MIDILFNIHACVPQIEYPSEHMIPQSNETVIIHQARTQVTMLGGDQLTIARARSAIKITANGETPSTRLEGILPTIEDWHTKLTLFEVISYITLAI